MELQSLPTSKKPHNHLARFSAYCTGISWVLLFGFIFSDTMQEHLASSRNKEGALICLGPLFFLSLLGLIAGIVTGFVARKQLKRSGEDGAEDAQNAIRYGLMGIAYIVLSPLLDLVLTKVGFPIESLLDFFR